MTTERLSHSLKYQELRRELARDVDGVVKRLYGDEAVLEGNYWYTSFSNDQGKKITRIGECAGCWERLNSLRKAKGDIFNLIAESLGLDFPGVVLWAEEFLNSGRGNPRFISDSVSLGETNDDLKNAGLENLTRSKSKLWRNNSAVKWLRDELDLQTATIEKFHLGIAEPFKLKDGRVCTNALSIPVIGKDGKPKKRRAYYNIPGVTINPKANTGWGCGLPLVCYSSSTTDKKRVFVCGNLTDLWQLEQAVRENREFADFLFVACTPGEIPPKEFSYQEFWSRYEKIFFGHPADEAGHRIAGNLRKLCFVEVKRVLVPEGLSGWSEFFLAGGTAKQFNGLLSQAKSMSSPIIADESSVSPSLGEFAINPVNCNGAYVGGYLYYPYRVERREIERITQRNGTVTEEIVTSYQTKIVRSDGVILDPGYLPAPRGTPVSERVLALSDGTRIDQIPRPSVYASWHLQSITDFIRNREAGKKALHRSLREILIDLENHFRRSIWLPFDEDYTILALYTALSFVYNVFDAIPLLIVVGPKGSAKSDLGAAIQLVAFNAVVIGEGTAASAVRVMEESRGLIVWDDLEEIAKRESKAFSDVHQILKLSYKKKTSKKAITGRNGKTTMFDFYGPKVINNTQGVDPILGSRMIVIQTKKLPPELRGKWDLSGSEPEVTFALRNELHIWGMASAAEIDRRYRLLLPERRGDRKNEILAPLQTIAELSASENINERLECVRLFEEIKQTESVEPIDLLEKALKNCIFCGYIREVALPHVQLQIALIVEDDRNLLVKTQTHFWLHSQWIGNSMDAWNFKEKSVRVRRARLYGKETRIYQLRAEFAQKTLNELFSEQGLPMPQRPKDPFDFCRAVICSECPFVAICDKTVPGLKAAKNKRLIH